MDFNFRQGTQLAREQDSLIKEYINRQPVSNKTIRELESNLWVAAARKLAPGNLVIRQYALIDLFKRSPEHRDDILELLLLLASFDETQSCAIYTEGYSYYCYTMYILQVWIDMFHDPDIISLVEKFNLGWIKTSYKRDDIWYPAPIGDLRDQPLYNDMQISHVPKTINTKFLTLDVDEYRTLYLVRPCPLGFNTHLPINYTVSKIIHGRPSFFKFYEGYDKKYKNKFEEIKDTFNIKRIKSILK